MDKAEDYYEFESTIFTATFNRVKLLERTYKSICAQTIRNFEWVVVDDGSTDETRQAVELWKTEADFPIVYYYQTNSGKHVGINKGVEIARGRYFTVIDSDDELLPDAMEKWQKYWIDLPDEKRDIVCSICGNDIYPDGSIDGDPFPSSPLYAGLLELRVLYRVRGEKISNMKTSVYREYIFPVLDKGGTLFEDVVWFAMGEKYQECYVNDTFMVFYQEPESVTRQPDPRKRSYAGMYVEREILNKYSKYFWNNPMWYLRKAANYRRCCLLEEINFLQSLKEIKKPLCKTIVILGELPARLRYLKDIQIISTFN